jgi:hypothetical protein
MKICPQEKVDDVLSKYAAITEALDEMVEKFDCNRSAVSVRGHFRISRKLLNEWLELQRQAHASAALPA